MFIAGSRGGTGAGVRNSRSYKNQVREAGRELQGGAISMGVSRRSIRNLAKKDGVRPQTMANRIFKEAARTYNVTSQGRINQMTPRF